MSFDLRKYNKFLVIDNGTFTVKAGFSGDLEPSAQILSVFGIPLYRNWGLPDTENPLKIYYPVGEEALSYKDEKGYYSVREIFSYRGVDNWYGFERIYEHLFNNVLKINPSECPMLITERLMNPSGDREKLAEVLFDKFKVPALAILHPEILALLATGRTTGIVVDIGYHMSSVIPIYSGFPLSHAYNKMDIGEKDINPIFWRYFRKRGSDLFKDKNRDLNKSLFEQIKREYSQVSLEPIDKEILYPPSSSVQKEIVVNGVNVQLGDECRVASEIYFQPDPFGKESFSLPQVIVNSVNACDEELREEMFNNIVLCGGGSMVKDLEVRLEREVKKLIPLETTVHITAPSNRSRLGWLGGSLMVARHPENLFWLTREEIELNGIKSVHKCGIIGLSPDTIFTM